MGDYSDAQTLNENFFLDDREFQAKFLLNPDIKDFSHFDHNISVTRLSRKFQEPEMLRATLKALHVLTKPNYYIVKTYHVKRINADTGEEEIVEVKEQESLFPKTHYHKLGTYHSIVQTSSAAEGHLIKSINTKTINKEESIEDKTTLKKPGMFHRKRDDSGYYNNYRGY